MVSSSDAETWLWEKVGKSMVADVELSAHAKFSNKIIIYTYRKMLRKFHTAIPRNRYKEYNKNNIHPHPNHYNGSTDTHA